MDDSKYKGLNSSQQAFMRFSELETFKDQWLSRVRECSRLTKALVVPPSGHVAGAPVDIPHASLGARLVGNLVSQLLLILFPPGTPFFKLDLKSLDLREMAKGFEIQQGGLTMLDAMHETFITLETNSSLLMETLPIREKVRMVLMELVVAGTSLYRDTGDDIELIPLTDWTCVRSTSGDLLEVVYRKFHPVDDTIEKSLGVTLDAAFHDRGIVPVFTRAWFNGKQWTAEEFINTSPEPFRKAVYNPENFPLHVPYWELPPGEDYGRGPVEENLGDFRTLESGTRVLKDSATALSKVVFMVKPNGVTSIADVHRAENTEIISGNAEDVGIVQANKTYDMSGFIGFLNGIKSELDMAFMMPTVLRREAERVTAEEIRRMAVEFERSRGGVYNSLSHTLQAPLARLLLKHLLSINPTASSGLRPQDLLPVISTGLQGLGRQLELENLKAFVADLTALQQAHLLKGQALALHFGHLRGLEVQPFLKSPEELMQERQMLAADQALVGAGPDIIKGAMT